MRERRLAHGRMADGRPIQTADVAALAGVTPDAIRRAVREGRLKVAGATGRGIQLYRRRDVDAYIEARAAKATGPRPPGEAA